MSESGGLARSTRWFWQGVALGTIALSLLAGYAAYQMISRLGVDFLHSKWPLLYAGLALAIVLAAWLLFALAGGRRVRLIAWVEGLQGGGLAAKLASLLTIPLALGLYFLVQDAVFKNHLSGPGLLWLYWLLCLGSGLALKAAFGGSSAEMLAVPILTQAVVFQVLSYAPDLSRYPFTLSWSEASRFYYASLPFAARLYSERLPLSILHPTRYLLQGIPFLIPGVPLWGLRLWQVLLWLGTTAITAGLLIWRLRPDRRLLGFLLALWFFLFMFQGAVYYHLQICIWIVLLGVSPRHPWRSLAAVLLASFWAGMSRINWFPVPAMLAAGLYFLEAALLPQPGATPGPRRFTAWLRYLLPPVLWFAAGVAMALASQAFYIYWSGNAGNAAAFGSSFTSDLLWYRLWPNPTFALGVVPGIALISLPPLAIIVQYAATKGRTLHPLRWLALAAMLMVLLGGGVVVSVKIGGGGDLHNMDAYLTLLGILAAYLFMDRAAPEQGEAPAFEAHYALVLFAMLVPVAFSISAYAPPSKVVAQDTTHALSQLRASVQEAARKGGQVLFINQRQLLTFGYIKGVPLVPDYELVILTEMAMSHNKAYLDRFYSDLANHRFAVIVAPSRRSTSSSPGQFAEEDNVWAQSVDRYLGCEYRVGAALPGVGLRIMVPRRGNPVCP